VCAINDGVCPLASIVIASYNQARFLGDAIDSALTQTYPRVEVIVVDDGSTDESRRVVSRYSDRIVSLMKDNAGADAARNDGLAISKGELVCFLDADDLLEPTAIKHASAMFDDPTVAKVHWRLWKIDQHGNVGGVVPGAPLEEGDLRDVVIERGPQSYVSPPTSGNAWARWFLHQVCPIPESMERRSGATDDILSMLAPLYGRVVALGVEGSYRVHDANDYWGRAVDLLDSTVRDYERCCELLRRVCAGMGIETDVAGWKQESWFCRLRQAVQELVEIVPVGETFILVDENQWGSGPLVEGRRKIPFLEREGQFWGCPMDDPHAIGELERLRSSGARFLVLGWSAFWWRDYYAGWFDHVRSSFRCVVQNERLHVFDLDAPALRPVPEEETAARRPREPHEHRVVAAWKAIDSSRICPRSVCRVEARKRDRDVYRLAFDDDLSVIAKGCQRQVAEAEAAVYERVLPHVSLPALRYYGTVDEPDTSVTWLFVQEAIGNEYLSDDPDCRRAAALWLAALHTDASRLDLGHVMPDRDVGYFLGCACDIHAAISSSLENPALTAADVAVLERVLASTEHLDSRSNEIESALRSMPRTVVHNDVCADNLRARHSDGTLVVLPFDWEDAGWGVPAIDLAQLAEHPAYSVRPDLETYESIVRQTWGHIDGHDIRLLGECGAMFRLISELHWEAWRLSYRYQSHRERAWLAEYIALGRAYVTRTNAIARDMGWR
jgi:thiamine kinase-like enzyme